MLKIPKNLFQIWIGDRPAPYNWMDTWRHAHPEWSYKLIDNDYIGQRRFRNQHLINEYLKRREFPGAADLIRYEILYEFGGFMPGADAICLKSTDALWTIPTAYTVFENEIARPGLVSPILAANPENEFVKILISELNELQPQKIGKAWRTTGNQFIARMLEKHDNNVIVFPSYYFIPEHFSGQKYTGDGPVYAQQLFGETTGRYGKVSFKNKIFRVLGRIRSAYFRKVKK